VRWRLLDGVADEDVRGLLAHARRRRFAVGEVVFHREDPADSLHLIVSGRFAVRISTAVGDAAMLGIRGAGEAFGELALLTGERVRSATVTALEPGETFAVLHRDLEALARREPAVRAVQLRLLAEELRQTSERLVEAYFTDAETRVMRRLRDLVALYDAGGEQTVVPLTQEELAALAGTSRGTANRVLRAAERDGTVMLARGRIVVLDSAKLGAP
jgi:CRP/FNR family transcriptional regulator, cyclic AMP receptor protein